MTKADFHSKALPGARLGAAGVGLLDERVYAREQIFQKGEFDEGCFQGVVEVAPGLPEGKGGLLRC